MKYKRPGEGPLLQGRLADPCMDRYHAIILTRITLDYLENKH